MIKTNAMRIIEKEKIPYTMHTYPVTEDHVEGYVVASHINKAVYEVFKTLVTKGSRDYFVFVVPMDEVLDLKKAAKSVGEKSIEMIAVKDINKVTGYIRGGCSPVGMKKLYKTVIHESAKDLKTLVVSAGKRGYQIEINPFDLAKIVNANFENIVQNG